MYSDAVLDHFGKCPLQHRSAKMSETVNLLIFNENVQQLFILFLYVGHDTRTNAPVDFKTWNDLMNPMKGIVYVLL